MVHLDWCNCNDALARDSDGQDTFIHHFFSFLLANWSALISKVYSPFDLKLRHLHQLSNAKLSLQWRGLSDKFSRIGEPVMDFCLHARSNLTRLLISKVYSQIGLKLRHLHRQSERKMDVNVEAQWINFCETTIDSLAFAGHPTFHAPWSRSLLAIGPITTR